MSKNFSLTKVKQHLNRDTFESGVVASTTHGDFFVTLEDIIGMAAALSNDSKVALKRFMDKQQEEINKKSNP